MDIIETFEPGDKIKHPKFGQGTVQHRSGEGEDQKLLVKFGAEVGEKKLVVKFANLKKIQDRPTLVAAPAEGGALPASTSKASDDNSEDGEDVDIEVGDDDEDVEDEEDEE